MDDKGYVDELSRQIEADYEEIRRLGQRELRINILSLVGVFGFSVGLVVAHDSWWTWVCWGVWVSTQFWLGVAIRRTHKVRMALIDKDQDRIMTTVVRMMSIRPRME